MIMRNVGCLSENFMITSPIGDILIVSCKEGLHSVKQHAEDDSTFLPNEQCCVQLKHKTVSLDDYKPALECMMWLQKYFMERVADSKIPATCGSVQKDGSFCSRAWQILPTAAPFGTTITYKDLAALCGNARACRAAGHAMATNPISYIVPCHRVVTTGNGIGNYSKGRKNKVKKWLLDFENHSRKDNCMF
ncbi:methylated-DNA--protein-cysteine methyltransferase [Plakobranchus ocellatus]|uniref:Methylated-DNA--protein-cysteine methyltransferase n=1 Tax=Plakobranchus ocellatus TaxID=259542 RepID=A0AAV4AGH0_9GAST|nr:methylated-DNA--protein-cysteine methyltransferase [Plakobranchus ocellatus]